MKKGRFTTALLVLVFFAGLILLLYPTVSNYWNQMHQTRAIASYNEEVAKLDDTDRQHIIEEARAYNRQLYMNPLPYELSDEERASYEAVLDITGTGIMGYIEIPTLEVSLPIYHGTSDAVLQVATGHLEWTSLPVGGESVHSVLSGHRGLPRAKLFTDLDKLAEGDVFMISVLDETFTYKVDQIRIVLPHELNTLTIEEGKDYCSLVTCTPYGINTHRLIVRGHRIENAKEALSVRVSADGIKIEPLLVSAVIIIPLLVIVVIVVVISDFFGRGRRKKGRKADE